MQRIQSPGTVATLPAPVTTPGQSPGYFNNPNSGSPIATVVSNDWCNGIQEELVAVIQSVGATPNVNDNTQLLAAIRNLIAGSARIKLTAPLTLYVNSSIGNDANNGLTAGAPYLTIQAAYNALMSKYDPNGFAATIKLADGTYTTGLTANVPNGLFGSITLLGNVTVPSNVVINVANANCVTAILGAVINVSGIKVQTTGTSSAFSTVGIGLVTYLGGLISFSNMNFGTCGTAHVAGTADGYVNVPSTGAASVPYTISGGAQYHVLAGTGSIINLQGCAVTLSGTPAFSGAYASVAAMSNLNVGSSTFTGSATGARYSVSSNSLLQGTGGVTTYLPGSTSGTTDASSLYI